MNNSELFSKLIYTIILLLGIIFINKKFKYLTNNKKSKSEITDKKFLNVYNDIANGYKIPYKKLNFNLKQALLVILIAILPLIFLLLISMNIIDITSIEKYFNIGLFIFIYIVFIMYIPIYFLKKERNMNLNNGNKIEYHLIERLGKSLNPSFNELLKTKESINLIKNIFNNSNLVENYDNFKLNNSYNYIFNNNINVNLHEITVDAYKLNMSSQKFENVIIFNGIFGEVDLDFNINGYIKILKNSKFKSNNEIDDTNFDKLVDLDTDNRILLMQLLTSDMMKILVEKYKTYFGMKFSIYINNNKLYFTFYTNLSQPDDNILIEKPDLKITYNKYCTIKEIMEFIELFYFKLKEISH